MVICVDAPSIIIDHLQKTENGIQRIYNRRFFEG